MQNLSNTQKWDTTSNGRQRYRRAHCGASQIWSNDIRARYFNEFLRFITSRFLKKPLIAHKPKTRSNTEAQTSTGATYTTHNHGTTPTNKTNTKYPISPERADIQSGCSTREQPLEKAYCIQIVFKLIEESMEKSALDGFTPALTKLEPNIATIAPLSVHSLISGMRTFTPYLFPASTRAARS